MLRQTKPRLQRQPHRKDQSIPNPSLTYLGLVAVRVQPPHKPARNRGKVFAGNTAESSKSRRPKLRLSRTPRKEASSTGACGGGILAPLAAARGSGDAGSIIWLKTVDIVALILMIAVARIMQKCPAMMTTSGTKVTRALAATHATRQCSTTTQTEMGMLSKISWLKLLAEVKVVANLKDHASGRLSLAALAADTNPAMTLARAVIMRARNTAASPRNPSASQEDGRSTHASQRNPRRIRKRSSSLRRQRRRRVKALAATPARPQSLSALPHPRLSRGSLRRGS